MANIPEELSSFKNKNESKLTFYSSLNEEVKSSLTLFEKYSSTFVEGINTYYKTSSSASVNKALNEISTKVKKINDSLDSFLKPVISKSSRIVECVNRMNAINGQISSLNKESSNYSSSLNSLSTEFSGLLTEASNLLRELKGLGHTIKKETEKTTITLDVPTGGKLTKFSYKGKNSYKLDYYIFIPEGVDLSKQPPLHVYLHGAGERGGHVLEKSLPKLITGGYKPSGIVLIPQITTKDQYKDDYVEDTLMELVNEVVKVNNVDKNRISLSGHSEGAGGGYKLIQRYPNTFSAFIPISGRSVYQKNIPALTNVKLFAFHGKRDSTVTYQEGTDILKKMQSLGGNSFDIHAFEKDGHRIQEQIFNNKYNMGGELEYPLDWAFKQVKS